MTAEQVPNTQGLAQESAGRLVAISILNWNHWQETLQCLQSVRKLDYPNYLIVVVDNGSVNDSPERIKAWAAENLGQGHTFVEYTDENAMRGGDDPTEALLGEAPSMNRLVLIRIKDNRGFMGGNNVAIHYALRRRVPAAYVFLLNNDAYLEQDCLAQLVAVHRQKGAGIVGAMILDGTDHHVAFAGRTTLLRQFFCPYVNWQLPAPATDEDSWTSYTVYGTAMTVSREALEAVYALTGDYLDGHLFFSGDEMALCSTALKAGYHTRLAKRAIVYHKNGKSYKGGLNTIVTYYTTRNFVREARQVLPLHWWILFQVAQLPVFVARLLKRLIKGNLRGAWAYALGLIDGYRGVGGKWKYEDEERQRLAALAAP